MKIGAYDEWDGETGEQTVFGKFDKETGILRPDALQHRFETRKNEIQVPKLNDNLDITRSEFGNREWREENDMLNVASALVAKFGKIPSYMSIEDFIKHHQHSIAQDQVSRTIEDIINAKAENISAVTV